VLPLDSPRRSASAGTTGVAWGVRKRCAFRERRSGRQPDRQRRGSPLNTSSFTPASLQIVLKITHSIGRRTPNENPVGKRIDFAWRTTGVQTIVGVIADMHESSLNRVSSPAVYIPVAQRPYDGMYLVVRGPAEPDRLITAVRSTVRALDPISLVPHHGALTRHSISFPPRSTVRCS